MCLRDSYSTAHISLTLYRMNAIANVQIVPTVLAAVLTVPVTIVLILDVNVVPGAPNTHPTVSKSSPLSLLLSSPFLLPSLLSSMSMWSLRLPTPIPQCPSCPHHSCCCPHCSCHCCCHPQCRCGPWSSPCPFLNIHVIPAILVVASV